MTAPALAPATSLDTGDQFDIGTPAPDYRNLRSDAGKVALARHLYEASDLLAVDDAPSAILCERWSREVGLCRIGRAVRDMNCGGHVFKPQSCDVRLCPDCERARSARLVGRYDEIAGQMVNPRHWTVTLENVALGALRPSVAVLLDALAHLRRRAIFAGGPCGGEHRGAAFDDVDTGKHHEFTDEVERCSHPRHRRVLAAVGSCRCARCLEVVVVRAGHRVTVNGCPRCTHDAVRGGIYSIEITWSPTRPAGHPYGEKLVADWHPHAHILMDAPYVVWSEMRDAWRAVTCDAIRRSARKVAGSKGPLPRCTHDSDECHGATSVWVSDVKGAAGSPERRAAVVEVLKYVSKGLLDKDGRLLPGTGPLELAELLLAIRGRRLVAGWGSFRSVHDDAKKENDTVPLWTGDVDDHGRDVVLWLPRLCPHCGTEAQWSGPVRALRRDCRRLPGGALVMPLGWERPT